MIAQSNVTLSTDGSNIGRSFGRNVSYILDDRLRPMPLGCVGQLFITGPQVAREYLGNESQTAKAFIEDPFNRGYTMYASGDLVYMSPIDHTFTFLGRRDTQIKIRGLRVEIGEIEEVLKAADNVVENAVVIKVDIGHEALVAFLQRQSVPASPDVLRIQGDEVEPLLASVHRTVRQKLPPYMVPTTYVVLNRFPLTSSGKLDRKWFVEYFYEHREEIRDSDLMHGSIDPYTTPQTELQFVLRGLWASVLHIDETVLGIDDNFFMAGGDSILAIRLSSSARDAGLSLPVTAIIRNPTIRQMSQVAQSPNLDDDYDDEEMPSATLDKMQPGDLTLFPLTSQRLDSFRNVFLPSKNISAR